MNTQHEILKATAHQILTRAGNYEWSIQGLGMLRLYLSNDMRLHIWSPEHAAPDASPMHTHPWDFVSTVVAGEVHNTRFRAANDSDSMRDQIDMVHSRLQCGVGGGITGMASFSPMIPLPTEVYVEGEVYSQLAQEAHISSPLSGTVTIIRRSFKEDTEHADAFWPVGQAWGSAEPRGATNKEVREITGAALDRWFA